jgi:hypothetical protein
VCASCFGVKRERCFGRDGWRRTDAEGRWKVSCVWKESIDAFSLDGFEVCSEVLNGDDARWSNVVRRPAGRRMKHLSGL